MLNKLFIAYLLLISISYCYNVSQEEEITKVAQLNKVKNLILDTFIGKNNTKELFKVWHTIFKKDYDYNTEIGIDKYKKFKQNLIEIKQNNQKYSWKSGLNHHSDKTWEEVEKYYHIRTYTKEEINSYIGIDSPKSFNLDDYEDNDQENIQTNNLKTKSPSHTPTGVNIDYRDLLTNPRDQENCGSCWAFTAADAVSGSYFVLQTKQNKSYDKYNLSVQQLIDCSNNYGCNGGFAGTAFGYYKRKSDPIRQRDYPYEVADGTCRADQFEKTPIKVLGYNYADTYNNIFLYLKQGLLGTCIFSNRNLFYYSSGIYDEKCKENCNHAVVIVGWGTENNTPYWIIRNSWSINWGEDGYGRIKDDEENASSCMVSFARWIVAPTVS